MRVIYDLVVAGFGINGIRTGTGLGTAGGEVTASVTINGLQDTVGYGYRTFIKVSYIVLSTGLPLYIEHIQPPSPTPDVSL